MSYSTFESNWPVADKKIRREVALLGLTTEKILVFTAGPFNEMSLATFIGVSEDIMLHVIPDYGGAERRVIILTCYVFSSDPGIS